MGNPKHALSAIDSRTGGVLRPAVPFDPPEYLHPDLGAEWGSDTWLSAHDEVVSHYWDPLAKLLRDGRYTDVLRLSDNMRRRWRQSDHRVELEVRTEQYLRETYAARMGDLMSQDAIESRVMEYRDAGEVQPEDTYASKEAELLRFRLDVLGRLLDQYEVRGLALPYREMQEANPIEADAADPLASKIAEAVMELEPDIPRIYSSPSAIFEALGDVLDGAEDLPGAPFRLNRDGLKGWFTRKRLYVIGETRGGTSETGKNIERMTSWARAVTRQAARGVRTT